jgi:redox-sensitive transcriptional activator SoxR
LAQLLEELHSLLPRYQVRRDHQELGLHSNDGIGQRPLHSRPANAAPSRADWERLSIAWRADLDERMEQLRKLRDRLDDCIGCGCLRIDRCRLRNPLDKLAAKGPGPQRLWVRRRDTG